MQTRNIGNLNLLNSVFCLKAVTCRQRWDELALHIMKEAKDTGQSESWIFQTIFSVIVDWKKTCLSSVFSLKHINVVTCYLSQQKDALVQFLKHNWKYLHASFKIKIALLFNNRIYLDKVSRLFLSKTDEHQLEHFVWHGKLNLPDERRMKYI